MAGTEDPEWIYLEDYIGKEGVKAISHEDCTLALILIIVTL